MVVINTGQGVGGKQGADTCLEVQTWTLGFCICSKGFKELPERPQLLRDVGMFYPCGPAPAGRTGGGLSGASLAMPPLSAQ